MEDTVRMQAIVLLVFTGYVTLGLSKLESPWIYNLGGAPLVLRSQNYCTNCSLANQHLNCQSSTLQGWRNYQEDRLFCDLNLCIPFFAGKNGVKEVPVGMAAVFDGHVGAEASEMASKLVLDYFLLHSRFIQNEIRMLGVVPDESMHLEILKEALVRTIRDIDITFTKEASKNGIVAGSTAAIVVIAYNQILVGNVGDSKVVLCSQKVLSPRDITGILSKYKRRRKRRNNIKFAALRDYKNHELTKVSEFKFLSAKELTRDHHPDREDERRRIEVAGGYVTSYYYDVPRVIGHLAVSRAIGDVHYKRFGVTAEPEITDWRPLTRNDSYLVISSDGMFESLNAQDVCQLLEDSSRDEGFGLFDSCQSPLPECLLRTAFEEGSTDNLSVIVVPLREVLEGKQSQLDPGH